MFRSRPQVVKKSSNSPPRAPRRGLVDDFFDNFWTTFENRRKCGRRGLAEDFVHYGMSFLQRNQRLYVWLCSAGNFRAQVVIDVANFAKTENGHETGPQGTDSSFDPTFGNDFWRRIRLRPPRGPKRPETKIKKIQNFQNKSNVFIFVPQNSQVDYNCVEITRGSCLFAEDAAEGVGEGFVELRGLLEAHPLRRRPYSIAI